MTRGKNLHLTATQVLARIWSVTNSGKYSMKPGYNGGADPDAAKPFHPVTGTADCVGVALWGQGLDRFQLEAFLPDKTRWLPKRHGSLPEVTKENPHGAIYGGYMNTNSMLLPNTLLREVAPGEVLPGDLLLYPSYDATTDEDSRTIPGHAMTVVKVDGLGTADQLTAARRDPDRKVETRDNVIKRLLVIHCNGRSKPATITGPVKIPPQVENKWRFVRPVWR